MWVISVPGMWNALTSGVATGISSMSVIFMGASFGRFRQGSDGGGCGDVADDAGGGEGGDGVVVEARLDEHLERVLAEQGCAAADAGRGAGELGDRTGDTGGPAGARVLDFGQHAAYREVGVREDR